jgi:hypothetical protein
MCPLKTTMGKNREPNKKNFDTACNDKYNANAICPNTEPVENGKVGNSFF